ncbi:uncharacterized protein ATNIH1004_009549 [Aspergillus tanneri]|uniref:F-box domain-containing protein n=1 Tax=Aspergillus tanneri TaxID=1220188 RepID=A0A5M9MIY4_9EURO|nr:uncharacterized protein ATNIH1004_009549 [Aspergillus tanneri]KAA8642797.1 hypothetical protein ATNIH1004_009549 [Aspergillus tanneri]
MASNKQPHRIFYIVEILEEILLQTEIRTLLISATTVCHFWRNVIQGSSDLQATLFFKPSKKRRRRNQNPFIQTDLWPDVFLRRHSMSPNRPSHDEIDMYPIMDPNKENAYLRNEASWRRMLLYQPPTPYIAVLRCHYSTSGMLPLEVRYYFLCETTEFLCLEHLHNSVENGKLLPCKNPLVFEDQMEYLIPSKHAAEHQTDIETFQSLLKCDAMIFGSMGILCSLCDNSPAGDIDGWPDNDERQDYLV